jgi:hypothetical protein
MKLEWDTLKNEHLSEWFLGKTKIQTHETVISY